MRPQRCEQAAASVLDHWVHWPLLFSRPQRKVGLNFQLGAAAWGPLAHSCPCLSAVSQGSPRTSKQSTGVREERAVSLKTCSFPPRDKKRSCWPPAAQGSREGGEGVAGTGSQSPAPLPAHQLHHLSGGFPRGHRCLRPPHICSESRTHSFHPSSFTTDSRGPAVCEEL